MELGPDRGSGLYFSRLLLHEYLNQTYCYKQYVRRATEHVINFLIINVFFIINSNFMQNSLVYHNRGKTYATVCIVGRHEKLTPVAIRTLSSALGTVRVLSVSATHTAGDYARGPVGHDRCRAHSRKSEPAWVSF